jgi:hypothetical protein
MADHNQSDGRGRNAAQPLGERHGSVSDKQTKKTAAHEQKSAGPDGPDASEITKSIRPG